MAHTKIARNKTHLTLVTGIQFLAYMSTDDTRFYVQLRNPTDRVISNLFYWHQVKLIYTHLPSSALNGGFIDTALQELLDKMQDCLPKYGEAACVYFPDAHDGVVESLIAHSMYIIFIEEMFKLIPRKQFRFKTLDEYSQDRVKTAIDLSENHFGVKFQDAMKVRDGNGIVHHGKKNPVWISTLKLLDDFFMPYNQRLATLLGNDKWLFKVNRTSAL
ncbi:carbohydrate sulfotransferase 15-like [Watersipora subatra]|uniref:carbohydrate sulfotransferase 15-like n=1 Tax=Watersipora subatra TaxID=2589382 RepID=UPI00355B88D2